LNLDELGGIDGLQNHLQPIKPPAERLVASARSTPATISLDITC
jgi:hypothetical protein